MRSSRGPIQRKIRNPLAPAAASTASETTGLTAISMRDRKAISTRSERICREFLTSPAPISSRQQSVVARSDEFRAMCHSYGIAMTPWRKRVPKYALIDSAIFVMP